MRPHLWALAGYFCLALIVTYPLALYFTTGVPGDLIADRDQHLWDIWWIGEALARFTNPFHTDMLYYPYGADLYYHALGLSHGLIGVIPLALWGLPAAYNTVVLAAFTLSGYGAFRLALLVTEKPAASFLAGVVFAFTPYTLDALKGQTEVLSVQWMPLYAEAWIRAWRGGKPSHMVAAGLFLALAAYGSLYYAVYLLLFTAAHILYSILSSQERAATLKRALKPVLLAGTVTLALTLPLLIGLARSYNDPRLEVPATQSHVLSHSADLLGLFAPPHNHPLFGSTQPPGRANPGESDDIALGYVALALALVGAITAWRKRETRFWVALGGIAVVLSLGPQLLVGGVATGIPMPFALVQDLPGITAIGKVSRFLVLAHLCMAVLAAWGAIWTASKLQERIGANWHARLKRALPTTALLALLLVELPIHPRYIETPYIPPIFQSLSTQNSKLKTQNSKLAIMDLPFATRQAETLGRRMLFQTAHGLPIMGGYLSRTYNSPIIDQCSPFWGFISAADILERPDIGAPTLESRPLDVLRFNNIGYLAIYSTYGGLDDAPLKPEERDAFLDIATRVSGSTPLYSDNYVSLYEVDEARPVSQTPAFHIGNGWYDPETSGDAPFRWLKEREARLCVFAPQPTRGALRMEVTAFGQEHEAHLGIGGKEIYTGRIQTGGAFTTIRTEPIEWPAGITEVRVTVDGQGITPQSLDPNQKDARSLTIGVKGVRLEGTP